ncbi:MAG TPA: arylsulfatase [Isosphaeraceae bacterium]|nr:arylsulfatase [Isosphaeraceae bacterium]
MRRKLGWIVLMGVLVGSGDSISRAAERPNVVLIMSDDQGYGDLGVHGNPVIRTPNIDKFAAESVEFRRFYVCPVCAPTRSSLMTGRYNYRTRVTDTYLGRALMDPDEVTLAEMLGKAGYRTGIFGKWHLGDNYPMRPIDQGFDEALVLRGGGIGQPSDPPGGESYFNPVLQHNGEQVKTEGYCSDVYTTAAIEFIEKTCDQPFFVYLPFNAPHAPLQVPEKDLALYKDKDLSPSQFPDVGYPMPKSFPQDDTARVYGMETNLDANVGRLLKKLDELDVAKDTIVIFLTDNGPQQPRYNAGLRGRKGSVYEGGIRVPFFVRWPGHTEAGRKVDEPAAHIDIAPTLLEACGVETPERVKFDGVSLVDLFEGKADRLANRFLFTQWHRGDVPEKFRAFEVRNRRWKLLQALGVGEGPGPKEPKFELFDIENDPYEKHDLASENPKVVQRLKNAYSRWFDDVCSTRGFEAPRIALGDPHESPTVFTRQDWRGPEAGWKPGSVGQWAVDVKEAGPYRVTFTFRPPGEKGARVRLSLGGASQEAEIGPDSTSQTFDSVDLKSGPSLLQATIQPYDKKEPYGVNYAEVERLQAGGSPRGEADAEATRGKPVR